MNLIKRKDNHDLWDPFDFFGDFQSNLSQAFGRSLSRGRDWDTNFAPDIELEETDNEYRLHADLPGIQKEDLKVQVEGTTLSIRGERKEKHEEKKKGTWYSERRFGSFSRKVQLPSEVQVDQVKANYKDGVLDLVLPKAESAKPKSIDVEIK